MLKKREKYLAIIPARGGSTRIPNKNIKIFNGKPLIYYAIKQAQESRLFDKIVVDTDSEEIARIAKKYGAEVPFLRSSEFATSTAKIGDAAAHLLKRLKEEQGYVPDIITMLQPTDPGRKLEDIKECLKVISKPTVKSVVTVCEINPWFFNLGEKNKIVLVNDWAAKTTNTQEVPKGYVLNGCMVYMIKTPFFLKIRKFVDFLGGNTIGVVCPAWRSLDIDTPEDWVMAEFIHKNMKAIEKKLRSFN